MAWFALWGAACAALGYAALVVWRLTLARGSPGSVALAVAFAGMAMWSAGLLFPYYPLGVLGKVARDLAWLAYLYTTSRSFDQETQTRRSITTWVSALASLAVARYIATAATLYAPPAMARDLPLLALVAEWLLAISGVFFAHLLYRSLISDSGSGFRLVLIMLGTMWAYDINLVTMILLGFSHVGVLVAFQGIFALVLMPLFALAARRKERWRLTLSRKAATSSVLLMAIGSYFVAISAISRALIWAADNDEVAKIIVALTVALGFAGVALFPPIGARMKKILLEHLFEHRYDYRSEWLRFSATITERSRGSMSLEERIIRSVADVIDSPAGLLLLVNRGVELTVAGSWKWQYALPVGQDLTVNPEWLRGLEQNDRIVTIDEIREQRLGPGDDPVPGWLLGTEKAWAGVPLVHAQSLIGLIILGRPAFDRPLDWEDYDLLKVIGQQAAMHLADAQSQSELEQARQFDEFNRRFAFIIHDLKNVVSQLSLVASNASEHGANPKFQESMARTIANATAKMTVLLSRLSADGPANSTLAKVDLSRLLTDITDARHGQHPIVLTIRDECVVHADAEQLRQAIDHLIQNAIEASPAGTPIELILASKHENAIVTVKDSGVGMSPEFVRKQLFKPFASTKEGGFGIGAAEAKALVETMGGDLDVMSVRGAGTQFMIWLPRIVAESPALPQAPGAQFQGHASPGHASSPQPAELGRSVISAPLVSPGLISTAGAT